MSIFRQKYFKVGLSLAVVALAVVITVVIAGNSSVAAKGKGGFEETGSLQGLKSARGLVADWAQTQDGRDWVISGEWTLDCKKKCTEAKLSRIDFDMAFTMYP